MTVTTGQHNAANINAAMGATGSGKSLFVKAELKRLKPARLMVWDFKREYGEYGKLAASLSDVVSMARCAHFKIIFQPSYDTRTAKNQFDIFCRVAFAAKRLVLIAEELAFVTNPGYAPQGWRMVTLAGRSEALTVYGTSQRPTGIDKDFFSNCTRIRTGRLNYAPDIKTMADVLLTTREAVAALLPLQYIERDSSSNTPSTGTIKFKK